MALNKNALASAIESELLSLYASAEGSPMSKETFAEQMAEIIAHNIVDHIKDNAVVEISGAQDIGILPPPSGDYTTVLLDGTGAPVTGTITTPGGGSLLEGVVK